MRRLLVLPIVLSALVFAADALAAPVFVIKGRGWGHSVGMSQWGAYGFAKNHDATYTQIIEHYYRPAKIGTASGKTIGVLLADNRTSLSIGAQSPIKVTDATKTVTFTAGTRTARKTSTGRIAFGGKTFADPATFSATPAIKLESTRYRGTLRVSVRNGALRAVNWVGLENYVKGVVPRESPDYWGDDGAQAALEAQAVAARSYALATGGHCGGGLFCPSISDQVYGGYDAEIDAPNARAAVDATAGKVAMYGGKPAKTYFHSSSGGRTAASVDVWGGDLPYLQSVRDYDLIPQNPHRLWRLNLSARTLASRLGTGVPQDATLTRDGSGLAQVLTVKGPGWQTPVEGSELLRGLLGVKSARFWIGVLSLTPARSRVTYGNSVSLDGLARPPAGDGWTAYLERKRYGGVWKRGTNPLNVVRGAWSRTVTPGITTWYRVTAGGVTAPASRVGVALRVRFYEPTSTRLRGVIAPKKAGATVAVQRRGSNGTWSTLATVSTNTAGEFAANVSVRPGRYRAIARLTGYVVGYAYLQVG
jgi:stage II sporulation protein D